MKFPKFKLPPNSLFAVLLRSRWWISFIIAAAFMLLAFAALPLNYASFAAVGTLPFWAIGFVALVRQWGQPSPKQLEAVLGRLLTLPGRDFSALLEQGFAKDGYTIRPSARAGADLRLESANGTVTLANTRRFKASSLGVEPLRELTQAMKTEGATQGIFVACGSVTEQASNWAASHGIRILDAQSLVQWLHQRKLLGALRSSGK